MLLFKKMKTSHLEVTLGGCVARASKSKFKGQDPNLTPLNVVLISRRLEPIIVPTGDVRHIHKIRFGKVSGEVFARDPERRKELGFDPIVVEE